MLVTPLYAGLLALWFVVLSLRVVGFRRTGVGLGDGGNPAMLRVIRGHANFAEYVPLALIMMGFLEVSRYSLYLIHGLGIALLVGRLLHGYALSFSQKFVFGRMVGTILTFGVLIVAGICCIQQGLLGFRLQ